MSFLSKAFHAATSIGNAPINAAAPIVPKLPGGSMAIKSAQVGNKIGSAGVLAGAALPAVGALAPVAGAALPVAAGAQVDPVMGALTGSGNQAIAAPTGAAPATATRSMTIGQPNTYSSDGPQTAAGHAAMSNEYASSWNGNHNVPQMIR